MSLPSLKTGSRAAIVSIARKITLQEIQPALDMLKSWGLEPVLGKNLFEVDNQYAGTDEQRAADLQWALDDDSIDAVIFARGGYGTVRVIDKIDFTKFAQKPKWIAGYSDITVLHSHIHTHFNIPTIHSVMLSGFPENGEADNASESLRKALFGEPLHYECPASNTLQRTGSAEGTLIGGNLSLLYALAGTPSDINTDGKILFIEDLDEYLYHVDRMMLQLKRGGKLAKLKALVVGGMSEMKDNAVPFGKTAEEIIAEAVKDYDYPVCYNFPAGHIKDNRALKLGVNIKLTVGEQSVRLQF